MRTRVGSRGSEHSAREVRSELVEADSLTGGFADPLGFSGPVGGSADPIGGFAGLTGGCADPMGGFADSMGGSADSAAGSADPLGGTAGPMSGPAGPMGGCAGCAGSADPTGDSHRSRSLQHGVGLGFHRSGSVWDSVWRIWVGNDKKQNTLELSGPRRRPGVAQRCLPRRAMPAGPLFPQIQSWRPFHKLVVFSPVP